MLYGSECYEIWNIFSTWFLVGSTGISVFITSVWWMDCGSYFCGNDYCKYHKKKREEEYYYVGCRTDFGISDSSNDNDGEDSTEYGIWRLNPIRQREVPNRTSLCRVIKCLMPCIALHGII